jgi:hypothetical protein
MRTVHSRRAALTAAVMLAAAGTTLAVIPSAAADQTLQLVTIAVPDRQTFLDPDEQLSPGDAEVFLDDVQRRGRTVGTEAGVCTIVTVSTSRLVVTCTATLMLPDGQITLQGVNDEDPTVGPTDFRWAVTGGTGRYADARGQATGTFRPGSDTVDLEVRLS